MDARNPIESSKSLVAVSASFNLNCDCFVVATTNGFRVFDAATCKQLAKRQLLEGGVGLIQIFGRTNVLPIVGGSRKPVRSPTKVVVWDEKKADFTREISCLSRIRGIRVLDRKVVVLLQDEVRVYNIERLPELETRYPTCSNRQGICAVSRTHLAFPGRTPGQIQLVENQTQSVSIIPAHSSALGAIALSRDGSLLATASEKGTLIRVWSTANNARVAELRRGVDQVTIFSLGFNPSGAQLACTSDKGTLHIFDVPHSGGAASYSAEQQRTITVQQQQQHDLQSEAYDAGGEWAYEDSDGGVLPSHSSGASMAARSGDGGGRWGVLAKIPFMPQYFRDTVSFASAEFSLDDGPGPNRQRESEEAAFMRWSRLPKGILGWVSNDVLVVLSAGVEPKYERFVVTTTSDGRRLCIRQAWANYMRLD